MFDISCNGVAPVLALNTKAEPVHSKLYGTVEAVNDVIAELADKTVPIIPDAVTYEAVCAIVINEAEATYDAVATYEAVCAVVMNVAEPTYEADCANTT